MRKSNVFFTALGIVVLLSLLMLPPWPALAAESYQNGVYRDVAPGYNDEVVVTVTVRDGRIAELSAENKSGEESEYFGKAESGLSAAVVEKQGLEGVEAVSGATGTSESILNAMVGILQQARYAGDGEGMGNAAGGDMAGGAAGNGATGGAAGGDMAGDTAGSGMAGGAAGDPLTGGGAAENATDGGMAGNATNGALPAATPRPTLDPAKAEVFAGLGSAANFRAGPGKDDTGTPVYSFNVAMASALFDKEGRILNVRADVYEVATPNYDGASMPHFSGWPGGAGYNLYDDAAGRVTGVSENTEKSISDEVEGWKTKRERGDNYGMNPQNDWYKQMNFYEQWMIGKTTQELRSWYARYTSERNGRPLREGSDNADDRAAWEKLSDEEKAQLYDVVSSATMSLSDAHGQLLEAIEKAYENRTPVDSVGLNAEISR